MTEHPTARAAKAEVDQHVVELYQELRALVAERMRRGERRHHTLAPTEVVHEAYLRLAKRQGGTDARQLRVLAAKVVWDVLVDYARSRKSQKRGGDRERLTLSKVEVLAPGVPIDVLDLHEALQKLKEKRPRQCEVVVLRFFGNLKFTEIAELMGIAKDTVAEHWAFAKAYLLRELKDRGGEADGAGPRS